MFVFVSTRMCVQGVKGNGKLIMLIIYMQILDKSIYCLNKTVSRVLARKVKWDWLLT